MKKKVLHVIGGMGRGGAPSFIINNLERIDPAKVQFDFLVRKDNCAYNEILKKYDCRIYVVPEFPRHIVTNFIETVKIFWQKRHEYDAIHVHANALYYILPLLLGRFFCVKKLILHSHNTKTNFSKLKVLHYLNRPFIPLLANINLACGYNAGLWMFGKRKFEVINNAIDVNKFKFNQYKRNEIRKELGINEKQFVIGNFGRFETAKNHTFLIDLFYEFQKTHKNSCLLLAGNGTLFNDMVEKVKRLNIQDKVYFLGVRSDIDKLYSAIDAFLLPSLYEGLPFVMVEAQCAGCKCLMSDNLSKETILSDLVYTESLDNNITCWCKELGEIENLFVEREKYASVIYDMKYDIHYTASRLQDIYTK